MTAAVSERITRRPRMTRVARPHLHWEAIVRNVRIDARLFTQAGTEP
jgi:hypothetical protein